MTRVKRGTTAHKRREKLLKHAKGFRWGRKSKERAAKDALLHAWSNMLTGRKRKKRDMRSLWQMKISGGLSEFGLSYSRFIGALKKKNIELDRKILAELAEHHPMAFKKVVEAVQ